MAHFTQIDDNNIVLKVIVVNNNDLLDDNNVEQESLGITFCQGLFGGTWVQTSYNGTIRKNYACTGYTYDSTRDAFIPPQSYASWTLNEETCLWEPPTAMPDDGQRYRWDEETLTWRITND